MTPRQLKPTTENIAWAIRKLSTFRHLRGFPGDDDVLQAYALAFLRIVRNCPLSEIHPDMPGMLGGDMNDADWLIGQALDRFDHFPLPIELRRIYQEFIVPGNGNTIIEPGSY